jgi:hypothetical protein
LLRDQSPGRVTSAAVASGVAPAVTALTLLAQLAALRLVLGADLSRAYFLGHAIDLSCAARARWGIPCPTCGVTRSLGLALHGRLVDAFRLFPAAPLAVFGLLCLAFALLALAWVERRGSASAREALASGIRFGSLAYAAAGAVIWLVDWLLRSYHDTMI